MHIPRPDCIEEGDNLPEAGRTERPRRLPSTHQFAIDYLARKKLEETPPASPPVEEED